MKKVLTNEYTDNVTVIERADWSITFYDVETRRHYERRVWYPVHGSDIYVQHRGGFYAVMTEFEGRYNPQAISRYETASAAELEAMAAGIIAHRTGKQYANDLTWEEITRIYAYAVICKDANTADSMYAVVNDILQDSSKQPEKTAEAAALSAYETARREANKAENADNRTRYAASILDSHSRAAHHAEEAERHAAAAEQAAQEVTSAGDICDADAADNRAQAAARTAADAATRYDATEATKAHAARAAQAAQEARAALVNRVKNLTPQDAEAATSSDYAERLAIEAAEKAAEAAAEKTAEADPATIGAAHEEAQSAAYKAYRHAEKAGTPEAREAAARAIKHAENADAVLCDVVFRAAEALADEAGADQQQREAARRVAYEELTGIKQASDADRETVNTMIEDIAARAAFEARRPSLEEVKAEFSNPFLVW